MLINNLYEILNLELKGEKIIAEIRLNPAHDIYKGHFPDQPLLPGVLQLQIVKEILSEAIKKEICLKSSSNIKFLSMIDPGQVDKLSIEIDIISEIAGMYKVNARIHSGNTVFLRLKGVYSLHNQED